jgi:hypothetical protein
MGRLQRRIFLALGLLGVVWIIATSTYLIKTKNPLPEVPKTKERSPPPPDSHPPQTSDVPRDDGPPKLPLKCPTINLVYTWVNGSDPDHIEARTRRAGNTRWAAPGNNRFRDLGGLFYSLRSAELHAPWINKIFIITSGQVPGFLNLDNPKIEIISHKDYFKYPDRDLPTFNSNAIEGSFPYLPDRVGPCFIYLNDDMFFGSDVSPSDFYDSERGQILFISSWTAPPPESKLNNLWHRSILTSNTALDKLWGKATRHYASHGPYFFSLEVLRHMGDSLAELLNSTAQHPFRDGNDAAIPFLYNQWSSHYFQTVTARTSINHYMKINDEPMKVKKDFARILDKRPKTVCMNDALDEVHPNPQSLQYMEEFFNTMFPDPSSFEKQVQE